MARLPFFVLQTFRVVESGFVNRIIAKRIAKATEEFRRRLLAKDAGEQAKAPARTRRGNRPMPFARGSKLKRTVGGKVVER